MKINNLLNRENNTFSYEEYLLVHKLANAGKSWTEIGSRLNISADALEMYYGSLKTIQVFVDQTKNHVNNLTNNTVPNTQNKVSPIRPKYLWTPEINSYIKNRAAGAISQNVRWQTVSEKITDITAQESQQIKEWVPNNGHRWSQLGWILKRPTNDLKNHYNSYLKTVSLKTESKNTSIQNDQPKKKFKTIAVKPDPFLTFKNIIPDSTSLFIDSQKNNALNNNTVPNTQQQTPKIIIKNRWTPEINSYIKNLIVETGDQKCRWRMVSKKIAETFKVTIPAKSIREHYYNTLDPTVNLTAITALESQQISEWVQNNGHRWSQLGRILNRPANDLKNHYNTYLKTPSEIEPEPILSFENIISNSHPLLDDYLNQHSSTSLLEDQNDLF